MTEAKFRQSLSFRLVAGTLAGFVVASIISLSALLLALDHYLRHQRDEQLKTQALDLSTHIAGFWRDQAWSSLESELQRFALTRGSAEQFVQLFDEQGQWLMSSDANYWTHQRQQSIKITSQLFAWHDFENQEHANGVRVLNFNSPDGFILQLNEDQSARKDLLRSGQKMATGAALFVLLVGGVLGFFLSRAALRGVFKLEAAAQRVQQDMNLAERVTLPTGSAETDRVAHVLNSMLDRINELVDFQKNTMDHIAHDVRSPVTRLRAIAEHALGDEDHEWAGKVIGECDYILGLVKTLLDISAAEAGIPNWEWRCGDPATAVEAACDLFEPLFDKKNIRLEKDLTYGASIRMDEHVWQRVVANLIDNAVKFSDEESCVRVSIVQEGTDIVFAVVDEGPGIEADYLEKVFQRFHRQQSGHTTHGSGLGLAYCRASVEAMAGSIRCESTFGEGAKFVVKVPLA